MREDRRRIPVGLTLLCLALGTPLLADESAWTPPETPENPLKSTELGQGSYPDPSSGTDRKYWRRNLFKRVGSDQKFLITTWWPAEFRRIGFTVPLAASVIGATQGGQGSSSADHQLSSGFGHWGSGEQKGAHEFLTQIGDRRAVAALIGSSYLISRWAGNERIERTASLTGEALINTTIYVGVLKRVSKRARPNDHGGGEFFISSPMEHEETDSFPSGHAAGAFAMAAVIAGEFHERRWVSVVAYSTATLITFSRVSLERHYPSDVIAGAVLGQSIGKMVTHRSRGLDDEPVPLWRRFQPAVDPGTGDFEVRYQHSW